VQLLQCSIVYSGMIHLIEHYITGVPLWAERTIVAVVAALVGAIAALIVHGVLYRVSARVAKASKSQADDILVTRLARPTRWSFVALGVILAARETPALALAWEKVAGFVMPVLIGWIALAILRTFVETMYLRYDVSVEDNRNARRRRTRLGIISRIVSFGIVFLTISLMLLSIPGVAKIGVTLMASAGLAALAVGAAAQPALKALIAGLQMALTEPISIDDVVVIDGEWGRIEDIRTTYVVVRVWDDRRLVVPTTRFLEDTFQNWTKSTAQLLGFVMLYLDPAADIGPIREEYTRQITAHRLWDKRAQILQVTDYKAEAIEVRLLLSAKDGPTLFDLRCEIRESMLDWIRRNQPEALVRQRLLPAGPVELTANSSLANAIGDRAAK
jgi:small-conductance mechanosensitive channel